MKHFQAIIQPKYMKNSLKPHKKSKKQLKTPQKRFETNPVYRPDFVLCPPHHLTLFLGTIQEEIGLTSSRNVQLTPN